MRVDEDARAFNRALGAVDRLNAFGLPPGEDHSPLRHAPRAIAEMNSSSFVEILRAAGVSHGFGIPSGNVLPLLEAMRLGGLTYVLTAHEGSAGFAAMS